MSRQGFVLHKFIKVFAAFVLVFALGACGEKDEKDGALSSGGDSSKTTTDDKSGDKVKGDPGDKNPEVTSDERSEADAKAEQEEKDRAEKEKLLLASPSSCVVGSWLADNENFGALLRGIASEVPGGAQVKTPTGSAVLKFKASGKYSATYKNWRLEMTVPDAGTAVIKRNGTDSGNYKAGDDGSLTINETKMNSEVDMTVPGVVGGFTTTGEPTTTKATFKCSATTLSVKHQGETLKATRR